MLPFRSESEISSWIDKVTASKAVTDLMVAEKNPNWKCYPPESTAHMDSTCKPQPEKHLLSAAISNLPLSASADWYPVVYLAFAAPMQRDK